MLIPVYLILMGLKLMRVVNISAIRSFLLMAYALVGWVLLCAFISRLINDGSNILWGGAHGMEVERILEAALGIPGVIMIIILLLIIFLIITKKASMEFFRGLFKNPLKNSNQEEEDIIEEKEEVYEEELPAEEKKSWFSFLRRKKKEDDQSTETEDFREDFILPTATTKDKKTKDKPATSMKIDNDFEIVIPEDEEFTPTQNTFIPPANPSAAYKYGKCSGLFYLKVKKMEEYDPTKDLSNFHFPSTELLKIYDMTGKGVDMEEQNANKSKIITTLQNYGIEITSIKATVGPTITLYEIVPKQVYVSLRSATSKMT